MRIVRSIAILLSLSTYGVVIAGEPTHTGTSTMPDTVLALEAAYKSASVGRVATNNATVVMQRIRKFIVVSFIDPCSLQHRCYGGRFHVVYDPSKNKVVYMLGEE